VDTKIKEQNCRIVAMTDIFKEALMLSNKTYFLEEMSKQRNIQKDLRKQLQVKEALFRQSEKQNSLFRAQLDKLKADMMATPANLTQLEQHSAGTGGDARQAVPKSPIQAIAELTHESLGSHDSVSKDLSAYDINLSKSQAPVLMT
jgi:protease II